MRKALVGTLALAFALAGTALADTVTLDKTYPGAINIATTTAEAKLGHGCWMQDPAAGSKAEIIINLEAIFGREVLVKELKRIYYWTKKPTGGSSVDWYLSIYTKQYTGCPGTWYGDRLNAEPMYSNKLNAPADQWNKWDTDPGTNQLVFFDGNRTNMGFYGGPTLADITGGEVNWGAYPNSGSTDVVNYADQPVKLIYISTATAWCDTYKGSVDAIYIELTDSSSVLLDLENLLEAWVDDDYDDTTPGWGVTHFATIQEGVDAVDPGGTVHVAEGTYTEQVEIAKNLTLDGSGSGTVILSPDTLTKSFTTSKENKPIVYVHDADDVVIRDLVVDGAGKGNANYGFIGIAYYNAGGQVLNCEIKSVQDTPLSGAQHGVGIYAYLDNGVPRTLAVSNCFIHDCQKNCLALNGDGLDVQVLNNTVVGIGPTDKIAQNGIQVGYGAKGLVHGNVVSGFYYTGGYWGASGILNYQGGAVSFTDNIISGCNMGLYIETSDPNFIVYHNSFVGNEWGLDNESDIPVNAKYNWWGKPQGAGPEGLVHGDTIWDSYPPNLNVSGPLDKPPYDNVVYLEPTDASIYVKPNELVVVDLNVANLQQEVTGLQAMLKFSSTYFKAGEGDVTVAAGGGDWTELIYNVWKTDGDLDVAVGVELKGVVGTDEDATTAVITLTPTGTEGTTYLAFRPDADPDPGLTGSTILSDTAGNPIWPAKVNSTLIYIDGTPPTLSNLTAWQGQVEVFNTVGQVGQVDATVTKTDTPHGVVFKTEIHSTNTVHGVYGVGYVFATSRDHPDFQVYYAEWSDKKWHYQEWTPGVGWDPSTDTTELPPGFRVEGDAWGKTFTVTVPLERLGGNGATYYWATQARTNYIGKYPETWNPWSGNVDGYAVSTVSYRDVLNGANPALQGTVYITVDAKDNLAWWDGHPDVTVTQDGNSLPVTYIGETWNDAEGTYTYQYAVEIGPDTPNGTWTITVSLTDKCGNNASISGTLEVNKNQITGTVTYATKLADNLTVNRNVVFVATDASGAVLKTWTVDVAFVNDPVNKVATGSYVLTDVPDGIAHLSAKTAWHLRQRQDVALDANGQAAVDFVLLGGDLNDSNSINILDYAVLKMCWYSHDTAADVNGDGQVDLLDFIIMKDNWFKVGDPQ